MYTLRRYGTLAFLCLLAVCSAVFSVADKPKSLTLKTKEHGDQILIPQGAIKIPLRDVQQPDDYSCGGCCFDGRLFLLQRRS